MTKALNVSRRKIWILALMGFLMSGVWISDGWGGPGCKNNTIPFTATATVK